MCQDCEENDFYKDDDDDDDHDFLQYIPEAEREDFFNFACEQFRYMIDQASERNILAPLITEWNRDRQAAFTLACVMEKRADEFKRDVMGDEDSLGN